MQKHSDVVHSLELGAQRLPVSAWSGPTGRPPEWRHTAKVDLSLNEEDLVSGGDLFLAVYSVRHGPTQGHRNAAVDLACKLANTFEEATLAKQAVEAVVYDIDQGSGSAKIALPAWLGEVAEFRQKCGMLERTLLYGLDDDLGQLQYICIPFGYLKYCKGNDRSPLKVWRDMAFRLHYRTGDGVWVRRSCADEDSECSIQ